MLRVTALYRVHDLCNDIHKRVVSQFTHSDARVKRWTLEVLGDWASSSRAGMEIFSEYCDGVHASIFPCSALAR